MSKSPLPGAISGAFPGTLRIILLVIITFFLACMFHGRWSAKDWQTPIEYGMDGPAGDVLGAQLAPIKAASEGNFPLIASKKIPAFGAPFEGSWDDFPFTEEFHIVIPGMLARWIGLFPALNLFGILAHVSSAVGFYLACRLLKYRREWAFAGAIVFGFSLFIFARSLHHLTVGWVGHIPLIIVVARWAFSNPKDEDGGGLLNRSHLGWALAVAVISGVQHVYYTHMLIQFLGLAALYQAFHRQWKSAFLAVLVGTVAMLGFLTVNLDTLFSRIVNGPNPGAVVRSAQYLEYSGFKLADLFIPPSEYWISPLGEWGKRYFGEVILKGEVPVGSFLGVIGIAAFLWLIISAARNLAQHSIQRPPWEFLLAAWVVIYSTVGGLNAWIGSLGFTLFRSTTRYSIFLCALGLMYAVRRLGAVSIRWSTEKRVAIAACVALIALWDQVPRFANEDPADITKDVQRDRTFAEEMESHLRPGSMVFQLPVMDFPENPIPGVPSYNHFRPYLYTKALRYSFGDVKGRPQTAWQNEVALLAPEALMQRLESYGFGALYINLNGYADRAETYLQAAKDRAATVLNSPKGDLVCILLNPSSSPELPPPGPYFAQGWNEIERNRPDLLIRGCRGKGDVVVTNPGDEPVERYFQFILQGIDEREITIGFNGATNNVALKPGAVIRVENLKAVLKPGKNILSFETAAPAVQTMNGPLAFNVINFQLTEQPR